MGAPKLGALLGRSPRIALEILWSYVWLWDPHSHIYHVAICHIYHTVIYIIYVYGYVCAFETLMVIYIIWPHVIYGHTVIYTIYIYMVMYVPLRLCGPMVYLSRGMSHRNKLSSRYTIGLKGTYMTICIYRVSNAHTWPYIYTESHRHIHECAFETLRTYGISAWQLISVWHASSSSYLYSWHDVLLCDMTQSYMCGWLFGPRVRDICLTTYFYVTCLIIIIFL